MGKFYYGFSKPARKENTCVVKKLFTILPTYSVCFFYHLKIEIFSADVFWVETNTNFYMIKEACTGNDLSKANPV